jgi:hypothetical protein
MVKAYMTGQQILDEYGRIDRDLIEAVAERRELQPIDRLSRKAIMEEDDPCLYCSGGRESEYGPLPQIGSNVPGRFCNADPTIFEVYICYEWQDEQLANRLRVATFSCDNIAAYAAKYWLILPDKDQQTGPEARPAVTMPTLPGTSWDQIRIRIATNDRFEIWRPGYELEAYKPESVNKCCQRCWLEISTIFFENPGDFRPENFQLKDNCRFASSENRLFAVFRRTTPRNAA